MKAISLWQPWATGMALGRKLCETRHWATTYRGPLAIHAAKRIEEIELRSLLGWPKVRVPAGKILGVVELVNCVPMTEPVIASQTDEELRWGNWQPGRFAWVTSPIIWFREPISVTGHQGLWDWEPPPNWRELGLATPSPGGQGGGR